MVVPIRELGNITLSNTTTCSTTLNMAPILNFDIAIDSGNNFFIDNKMRGYSLALSVYKLRTSSMSSSKCDEEYHIYIKRNSNRMEKDKPVTSIDSIQIEYISQKGRNGQVSKIANSTNNMNHQCITNENPTSSSLSSNNMFNMQLNYDINQTLDLESWDGKFHAVSLYRSIKHLASDIKNIKDSLHRIGKYIKDKSIIDSNANSVKDLEGMGKVV